MNTNKNHSRVETKSIGKRPAQKSKETSEVHWGNTVDEKSIKLQRLRATIAPNFPNGVIGILNREMRYVLVDGKNSDLLVVGMNGQKAFEDHYLQMSKEELAKLKTAFDGECVHCEAKAQSKIYNITAVPLIESGKKINEILCVLQNVTEQRQMEEDLINALAKEKELGELKSRFVTMASHEFRTPLSTILSSTFLLENYAGQNYDKEKLIHTNRIRRAVNSLTMILNEFLSLEKLEENKVRVTCTDITIPDYIQDLIDEMSVAKRDGQTIEYRHSGAQSTARLDHQILWSIVTNLISNALKYSKSGDKIEVTSEINTDSVALTVTDSGIGIPADEHQYIFGRFYRARNAANIEGTGLGLHIVQKYVHLLKGSITFESELDRGTVFKTILPKASNGGTEHYV
jgi:signal transduction histidine kinase